MQRLRSLAAALMAVGLAATGGLAGEPATRFDGPAIEFFEKEVRPLLSAKCLGCHGSEKQKGGLRLDSRASILAGGDSGPAIVPGKPEESRLVAAINYDEAVQMPPKSRLPATEVATLTKWVAMNAPWPGDGPVKSVGAGAAAAWKQRWEHWSLKPLRKVDDPKVIDAAWPKNAIDRFILAGLDANHLKPAPDADRRSWLRRVTFDLIGLPPKPEEIEAFVADKSTDAYEKVVERLLASPHYGERWGRHWLDLVRFSETSGHEFDYEIPDAWRYRDYVTRAFNADLPYNQFVTEQIAGDLLTNPRRDSEGVNESILGTGFFFLVEGTHSPVDVREEEASRIDNQIDVFGKAFLGLTIACARCHDHKFDAITTKDYYALSGYLKSSRHQHAFLDSPDRIASKAAELETIKAKIAAQGVPKAEAPSIKADGSVVFEDFNKSTYDGWFITGDAFGARPSRDGDFRIEGATLAPVAPGQAHSGRTSDRLQGTLRSKLFTIEHPYIHFLATGRGGRLNLVIDGFEKIRSPIYGGLVMDVNAPAPQWLTMDVAMWRGHRAYVELGDGGTVDYTGGTTHYMPGDGYLAVDEIRVSDHPTPPAVAIKESTKPVPVKDAALVARTREVEAQIPAPRIGLAIADGSEEDDRVHIRGSSRNLGEVVPRRFIEALGGSDATRATAGSGRLDLARRVVDPSNPLTARVMVNRIWKHHFGEGLIRSPDDFGLMGQPPSNPELLDRLAAEFIRGGWSIKHMHRMMTLSHTYQMSSAAEPEADRADPTNRLVHRMNVRRLEAEAVRDAMLAVSGRLDPTLFGPSVPTHLTPFMEGRGRPGHSGPLDGDGRRSLYLNVRRNFLSPFLLAFDFPTPASCMGRRNVSNVPAQALTLLNDPLVIDQAKRWAVRTVDAKSSRDERIDSLYRTAFGRPATAVERKDASAFLDAESARPEVEAWTDLCHVLMNTKEFLFIP
jgi:hypothetical protein